MRTLIWIMKPDTMETPIGYTDFLAHNGEYPAARLTGLPEEGEVSGDQIRAIFDVIRKKGLSHIQISGITGSINNGNGLPTLSLESGRDKVEISIALIERVEITRAQLTLVLTDRNSHTFNRPTEKPHG